MFDGIEVIEESNSIGRLPGRGGEQGKILPAQLQAPIFLHQCIAFPRKHPKQQAGLGGRVTAKRNGAKPDPAQLIPPPLHLHLPSPLGPTHGQNVPYLTPKQLLLHHMPL